MLVSIFRPWLACSCLLLACSVLPAQQIGGGTTGGTSGQTGGTTGGSTGIGSPTTSGAGGTLDPDAAFSQVERAETVGATGGTGSGFSQLSVGNQGGAGGTGGLGGFRGLGGGGIGGLGGLSSLFGGLNTQGQATKPAIRTRLRSAVQVERRAPAVIQSQVGERFASLARPELQGVNVTVEGRKGILTGVVQSDRHRRMSELLLRLEPGINEIENRLEVAAE